LRQPVVLWAWLLAACSVAWPYLAYLHDSRLYAGQVLSRLDPELLRGDLFFEFGSQDRFSLFSTLMSPLVRAAGFDVAFFAFYVVSLGLFLAGLQRVVFRLVPDSAGAVIGLLFAATASLPYGGQNVFHVIEPFTTPRLIASALTLFGLAWTLDGQPVRASVAFAAGLAFHPLMAFPAAVVALGYGIWQRFGGRVLGVLIALVGILTAAIFAIEPLGSKLLGVYDETWKDGLRQFCLYQFPDSWRWSDWSFAAIVLVTGAAATWHLRSRPNAARFVAIATAVGAVGLVGMVIAMRLPYALPIMGQPYRAMWLPTVLAAPLLFAMLERVWRRTDAWRYAALVPLLLLAPIDAPPLLAALFLALVGVRLFRVPVGHRVPALAAGTVLGAIVLTGVLRIAGFLVVGSDILACMDPMHFWALLIALAGSGLLVVIVVALMRLAGGRLASNSTAAALVGFAVLWQTAFFAAPHTKALETTVDPYRPGIDFVAKFLRDKRNEHSPQVYSNLRRIEIVWLDWKAQSYYDVNQTAGFLFSREATLEGLRRATLTGPFEVDCVRRRRAVFGEAVYAGAQRLGHFDGSMPLEPAHLRRLASDSRLDWIVLWDLEPGELLDLATARGPRVAVFDAAKLRESNAER
jgi:hypothetical protein